MRIIEKFAIKYLLVGIGIGLLKALFLSLPILYFEYLDYEDIERTRKLSSYIITYLPNIIVGLFLLFDSFKYTKNKILIPVLGLCIPVFGVCFLIMESYLISKIKKNE